jgi:integrase
MRAIRRCAAVAGRAADGARYSELTGLEARDFDRQSQTLWLRETKAGVARAVYLEGEGVRLFDQATAGKKAGD